MSNFYLLEKNESFNNLFRRILQMKGHEVVGCMDDYSGFLKLMDENGNGNGNSTDYVIIDNNVVSDNYVEIANQILKKDPKLRIIFINTNDTTPPEKHYDTGSVSFVKEKFSIRSLYNTIERLSNY
jgi:two-component SAPR family response regulator